MKYLFTSFATLLILVIVLLPGSAVPDVNMVGFDKIVHIGLFGLWSLAVYYDFKLVGFSYFVAFCTGVFFSLFTEFLQLFVEDRTFDWFDFLADGMGLILGLTFGKFILKNFLKE